MIAAKWGDPVAGVDVHLVMVPTPAGPVPTPLPHPFVGVVFDPLGAAIGAAIGLALGSGGPVLVNGLPTGNTGTGVRGVPHIPTPPGVSPAPGDAPTGNEGTLVTGSKTVHFGGSSESRTTSLVSSCSFPVNLPTSVCLAVPAGPPVLIGGPEALDVLAAILAGIRTKWVSEKLHALLGAKSGSLLSKVICFLTGHPVDVMSGELIADAVDFELPGMIPIKWQRNYRSRQTREGSIGPAWTHPFDDLVEVTQNGTRVWLSDGRHRDLPPLRIGQRHWDGQDRFTLERTEAGYELRTSDSLRRIYRQLDGASRYVLVAVRDRAGNEIALTHERGYLTNIRDTAGRALLVAWTPTGRVEGIYFRGQPLVRYQYTPDGRLAAAVDPLGHAMRYGYDGGVLVEEVHKGGLTFHFEWDYAHPEGWCVRTWGENPHAAEQPGEPEGVPRFIYDRRIKYDPSRHFTSVEDGRGGITQYWGDGTGLVVKERRPGSLAVIEYTWNEHFQKTSEIDGEGNKSEWIRDERGNCTVERNALGYEVRRRYDDEDKLVEVVDEAGGTWRLAWHPSGKPASVETPLGVATRYEHDRLGRLVAVEDPMGRTERFAWDDENNLVRHSDGEGNSTAFKYDELGRNTGLVDAVGRITHAVLDPLGRVLALSRVDGEHFTNEYDPEGNLVSQIDALGRKSRMAYAGMNRLIQHVDAMGYRVRFIYDPEETLVAVENEANERYRFARNSAGAVIHELGFDGKKSSYLYDKAGRVNRVVAPDASVIFLERDALGRIVKRTHTAPPGAHDGPDVVARVEEETFCFTPRGEVEAANVQGKSVVFERDEVGRVVREVFARPDGDANAVRSRYDYSGLRLERETSLGHRTHFGWNRSAELTEIRAGLSEAIATPELRRLGIPLFQLPEWELKITRNALGLETARQLPGGVVALWKRDVSQRPLQREVVADALSGRAPKEVSCRSYVWSGPTQIAAISDRDGRAVSYEYDGRGHLVAERSPGGTILHRSADSVANLYRSADRRDRVYGRGGRLERAGGTEYRYDGHGNLIEKILADGGRWAFSWTPSGRVDSVLRPDGKRVRFEYDALGRRVSKSFAGRVTEYVWDGDDLVHERTSENGVLEPLVTWIFEPGTFAPVAKFTGRRRYSVITDHLGSPTTLMTESGKLAWEGQLDVYGVPRESSAMVERADATDNPWRYPGQYEDKETGLYYNRFRYYDPESGRYISEDPIRMQSGSALYSYVEDPAVWIDAFGLSQCGPGSKAVSEEEEQTSRAARRKVMREQGIPTSQQPTSQARDASGRYYEYQVPKAGGGAEEKSVQQQTMDRSHPGDPHWEAGGVKTDPNTGATRTNNYGRPKMNSGKSKANYSG